MREEEGKSRRFFSSGNEKRKREQYSTRSKPLQPFHFVPPATPLPRFRFTSQLGSILTRWRARFIGEQFQFRPEARNGQRSAFLLPPPLPIVEGRGEVWVLLNGRSNHWLPPSARLVPSCLPSDFRNRFTVISSLLCSRIGWRRVCLVVRGLREGSKFTETRLLLLLSLRPMWSENIVEAHCWQFERRSGNRRKSFCEFFCCFLVSLFHFFLLDMYIVHVFFFFYKGIQRVLIKIGLDTFIDRVMIRWI